MKASFGTRITAVLVLGAAALVVFLLGKSGQDTAPPRPSGSAQASMAAHERGALRALPAPAGARPPASDQAPAPYDEPPVSDDYHDNHLAEVLHRVLAADPQLRAFKYYHNRPLRDEASESKYHELLSNPEVFAGVKHDLLYPAERKVDQEGSIKRLMKIDYLREALEWKENPMRDEVIAMIVEMILTDNYPPGMGMDMRISLSGNKMELYSLLDELVPEQAQAVVRASKGTRLAPMIAHFASAAEIQKRHAAKAEGEVHL